MSENYIGFWRRFVALMVDLQIIAAITMLMVMVFYLLSFLLMVISPELAMRFAGFFVRIMYVSIGPLPLFPFILVFLYSFYFTMLESSPMQATYGKRAIRAVVTDRNGDQITFTMANVRFYGKIISAILLMIGFIMTGFTIRKKALHDFMSGCLVVEEEYSDRDANYVGFWRRFVAIYVDYNIISVVPGLLGSICLFILGLFLFYYVKEGIDSATIISIISSIMSIIPDTMSTIPKYSDAIKYWKDGLFILGNLIFIWLYFTIFEFSSMKATLGKWAIGAVVTDLEEERISYARSNVRFWTKPLVPVVILLIGIGIFLIFPSFYVYIFQIIKSAGIFSIFYIFIACVLASTIPWIGFLMAGFTDKKQGLHDIIAKSLVVNKPPPHEEEIIIEQNIPKIIDQKKDGSENEQQEIVGLSLDDKIIGMAKEYCNNNECLDYYSKKSYLTKGKAGEWKVKEVDDFTYLVDFKTDKELYSFEVDFNTGIVCDVWSDPRLRGKYGSQKGEDSENNESKP